MRTELFDVIIIGSGGAGLTAGKQLVGDGCRVLILDKKQRDTQAPSAIYPERRQAAVSRLSFADSLWTVYTNRGRFCAFAVVIASGTQPKPLGVPGEEKLLPEAICRKAALEGARFADREVFVVGGSYEAAQESLQLAETAAHVTVLIRESDFSCDAVTAGRVRANPKISVLTHTTVEQLEGTEKPVRIVYRHNKSAKVMEYASEDGFGLFIYAGKIPASAKFASLLSLDEDGYILVNKSGSTEQPGLYAAGDVCAGERMHTVEEITAACAGIQVWCEEARLRTGLIPAPVESSADRLFEDGVIMQLWNLFDRMDETLLIRVYRRDDLASGQLVRYMEELADLTDKLQVEVLSCESGDLPCAAILREGAGESRLYFHGIPDAYAFTPFVLLLYHTAGSAAGLSAETRKRAQALPVPVRLIVMIRPDDPH